MIKLTDRKIRKGRVECHRMNKRGSNRYNNVMIETVPSTSNIANMRKRIFTENGSMIKYRHVKPAL
jgi:hypothetical protein